MSSIEDQIKEATDADSTGKRDIRAKLAIIRNDTQFKVTKLENGNLALVFIPPRGSKEVATGWEFTNASTVKGLVSILLAMLKNMGGKIVVAPGAVINKDGLLVKNKKKIPTIVDKRFLKK